MSIQKMVTRWAEITASAPEELKELLENPAMVAGYILQQLNELPEPGEEKSFCGVDFYLSPDGKLLAIGEEGHRKALVTVCTSAAFGYSLGDEGPDWVYEDYEAHPRPPLAD